MTEPALPTVGGDKGTWAAKNNAYLEWLKGQTEDVVESVAGKADSANVYDKATADGRYATTAQGAKADTAVQPAGLTKAAVGLGSVDNTADTAKPVSVAQAAANTAATAAAQATSAQRASNLSDLAGPALARETLLTADYGKLLPWFAALANRRKAPCDVLFGPGDSGPEGYALTSMADTLPIQFAEAMRSRFGVRGVAGGRGFIGVQNDLVNMPFWPDVYTGGTKFAAGYGPNRRHYVMTAAGHKIVRTVPPEGLTGFDLHYIKGPGSPVMYYKIGAGSNVTFSANNATLLPAVLTVTDDVPGGSTIEVGWSSGGSCYYTGITEFNGDDSAGVRVHNLGQSGSTAALWRTTDTVAGQWLTGLALFNPKAIIIELGGNDARTGGGNVSAATFQTNLTGLIADIRLITGAPIVLSMMFNQSSTSAGMVAAWSNYVNAAKTIAAADSTVVVVDHSVRMTAWDVDGAQLYNAASPPHAAAKGYALMADTLVAALSPR